MGDIFLQIKFSIFLGDPDNNTLRVVEREILIPKIMRDRAKKEKCVEEVRAFTECCRVNSIMMSFKCQAENEAMKACQTKWYSDEAFKNECKGIYMEERRQYRLTGVPKKYRNKETEE